MALLPVEQQPFVCEGTEAELEDALAVSNSPSMASSKSSKRRFAAAGAVLGLLAVAAVVRFSAPASSLSVANVSESVDEALVPVKGQGFLFHGVLLHQPFKQCDGEGFKNSSCCFKGCACVKQSNFYSQCETPLGSKVCNLEKAKIQAGETKQRHEEKIRISKAADHRVKYAEQMVARARKAHQDAAVDLKKPLATFHEKSSEMTKVVKAATAEHDATVKDITDWADKLEHSARVVYDKVKNAETAHEDKYKAVADKLRAKADATAKASIEKSKEHKDVKKELEEFAKAAKARDDIGNVPGIFNDCTGPKVCALGCKCVFKNNFYGQCAGVHGESFCNWKPAAARNSKLLKEMPTIEKDDKRLKTETVETEEAAKKAEKKSGDVNKVSDAKIAKAKAIFDSTTAPTQKKTKAKMDAAKEEEAKKTSPVKKEAAAAKDAMLQAVLKVKKAAHKLAMAEAHLETTKKAATHARAAIEKTAQAAKAWGTAAKAQRCLKGEDANWR